MKNDSDIDIFKIEDRYCPICGNFIKAGSPEHYCSDKDLKRIYKEEFEEDSDEEIDRSYADKLNEFNEFYDSDSYYDNDTEEE